MFKKYNRFRFINISFYIRQSDRFNKQLLCKHLRQTCETEGNVATLQFCYKCIKNDTHFSRSLQSQQIFSWIATIWLHSGCFNNASTFERNEEHGRIVIKRNEEHGRIVINYSSVKVKNVIYTGVLKVADLIPTTLGFKIINVHHKQRDSIIILKKQEDWKNSKFTLMRRF